MQPLKIVGIIILTLFIEGYILVSLPKNSTASTNPSNSGGCDGVVQVTTSEAGVCGTNNYTATYSVHSLKNEQLQVAYNTQSWYCTNPDPHMDGHDHTRSSCRESLRTGGGSLSLPAGQTVYVPIVGFSNQSLTCGSQQTDLSFDVYKNGAKVCSYGNPNFVYGWSFCTTGTSCNAPQPSPSTTPIPTVITPVPTTPIIPEVTEIPQVPEVTPPTQETTTETTVTNTTTGCQSITQNGVNNNANCPNQTQTNVQNANPVINVQVAGAEATPTPETPATPETVSPVPVTQLPSTGSESDALFVLGGLIPLGVKLRKFL